MASQKSTKFVNYVFSRIINENNKEFRAKLKKADNEATEYQSWDILSQWVDLENDRDRKTYGLVGASIARSGMHSDGKLGLGGALRAVFQKDGDTGDIQKSSSALRLRRLLSCKEKMELIEVLRPILRFLISKEVGISHTKLLDDILWFDHDTSREKSRVRWAQDFFSNRRDEE